MTGRVELYRSLSNDHVDQRLQWRWRYVSANGRILADGAEGYSRRIDCLRGCASVLGGVAVSYPEANYECVAAGADEARVVEVRDLTRAATT